MSGPKWDIYGLPLLLRLMDLGVRWGRRSVRARGYGWLQGNSVSQKWQVTCTYELPVVAAA